MNSQLYKNFKLFLSSEVKCLILRAGQKWIKIRPKVFKLISFTSSAVVIFTVVVEYKRVWVAQSV
jgi:hypothetical protein